VVEVGVFAESLFGLGGRQLSAYFLLDCERGRCHEAQGSCTHHLDDGQNPGLRIVISVGSNAQIDLLGVFIATEGGHQPKQRVFWRLGDDIGVESGSSHWFEVGGDLGESCLCRGLGRSREGGSEWFEDR
jgi:hypothetical protein